jgi:tetratricopeptide (TPR) repeat protein
MHPENAEGWLGLAHLLAVSGLPAEAEVAATRALRVAPAHAEAYRFRAELRYQIGRYFGADLDIKKATRLAPSEASAWDLPGKVTAQLKTNAARAHALSQRPHMAAGESGQFWPGSLARLMQGVIQKMQEKKWGEAVTLTRQARETYPGTMVGPWLAALVELGQDRLPEAERLFREAYDVAPRSHRVITGLLRVWARKNGAEVAADRLMELAVRDPEFAYLREVASEVYLQARQPSKAEAALRKGFDLQADSAVPHQQLAELFLVLDRGNEALTVCQKGLERFPNAPELLQLAGQINADLGKPDAAIEAFEAYLSKYPDERWPAGQLAMLLATQRNDAASRQRAKQLIDQLESDAPADAALLDAMGWVHFKLGRIKRARELLVAAAANSEDPSVHYHLAAAYARAKETDRARSELRVALDSARPFAERLDAQRLLRELGS